MNFKEGNDINNLFADRFELEAEEMFCKADRLLTEGLTMEAVEKLSQILKRNPRFGKAHNHIAWAYEVKYNKKNLAEEHYKMAMEYAPDYIASYLNYCYLLSSLARFDELKEHLDKMSNIAGIAKEILYMEYAILSELQGDIEAAIDYYRQAAIVTLDTLKLDKYKESIERCHKKLDLVESVTGYNFFSNVADSTENVIESVVDTQP